MNTTQLLPKIVGLLVKVPVILILLFLIITPDAQGAELVTRSTILTTSIPAATGVSYDTRFSVTDTVTVVRSVEIEVCAAPVGACVTPSGFVSTSHTLSGQPTGLGDNTSWIVDNSTNGLLRATNTSNTLPPSATSEITFDGITNPSTSNKTFYLRVATYSDAGSTTIIDEGVTAVSTADGLGLTGIVPPILTFCVGTSIPGDCTTATGSTVDFGTFSPLVTATGMSKMQAGTNAAEGYVITVIGATLSAGTNTIAQMATQANSTPGTAQFGLNLVVNSTPPVGQAKTGTGTATATAQYSAANQFRYNNADPVAFVSQETRANTFTSSYIVNIPDDQPAGTYNITLTYVCTATF